MRPALGSGSKGYAGSVGMWRYAVWPDPNGHTCRGVCHHVYCSNDMYCCILSSCVLLRSRWFHTAAL